MNIRLGIYEIFSRIIPGGVYIVAIWQLLDILGVTTIGLQTINSFSLPMFIGLIVVAYILGGALDNVALTLFRLFKKRGISARSFVEFKQRHQNRWVIDFKDDDWSILLAYIRTKSMELASEIERHNAISIMSRNISTGLVFIAGNSILQFLISRNSIQLVICLLMLILSALTLRESIKFRGWFYDGIYETILAYRIELEKSITPVDTLIKKSKVRTAKRNDAPFGSR
jgi:hypothetical protein